MIKSKEFGYETDANVLVGHIRRQFVIGLLLTVVVYSAVLWTSGGGGNDRLIAWLENTVQHTASGVGSLFFRIMIAFLAAGSLFVVAYYMRWLRGPMQPRKLTLRQLLWEGGFVLNWIWSASVLGSLVLLAAGQGWIKFYFNISDYGWVYFCTAIVGLIIAYDTYFYFVHRLMHKDLLWKYVHSTHHLTICPNPVTQFQLSPIEQLVTTGFYIMFGALVPTHPLTWVVFSFIGISRSVFGHLNYEIFPKIFVTNKWLSYIATGTHHNQHHAYSRCNYAFFFTFWDRVCGTLHRNYESDFLDLAEFSPARRRGTELVPIPSSSD